MEASDEFVTVASYLTQSELDPIKSELVAKNINFAVNGHDAASRHQSLYYEIRVPRKHYQKAFSIVKSRQAKTIVDGRKCPKCESNEYGELEKKSVWERIYYYGTTLAQCKKCKTRFPV